MPIPQLTKTKVQFCVVNGFTLASLFLGLISIVLTTSGQLHAAALCLLACVFLDGCDGNLARKWSVSSPFGEQLDSLADMTAFGVAIALFSYDWILAKEPTWGILIGIVCSLVALTSAIRLARFNTSEYDDRYFQGIPTTVAAAMITFTYLVMPNLNLFWSLGLVGGLSVLMVSQFSYPKVKQLLTLPILGLPILCIMLMWDMTNTVLLAEFVYLTSGPILSWHKRRH